VATAVLRVLSGSVDGVNVVFQTPVPYRPGSVRVFVDGQLKREDFDDGWIELGYDKVQLKLAPFSGSVVQAYFLV
jgi:hypothetical protein